jgi:hypothetical protein
MGHGCCGQDRGRNKGGSCTAHWPWQHPQVTSSPVTACHPRACVVLQPGMEMATACAKPSHLAASIMPCLKASGYTCAPHTALSPLSRPYNCHTLALGRQHHALLEGERVHLHIFGHIFSPLSTPYSCHKHLSQACKRAGPGARVWGCGSAGRSPCRSS